MKNNILLIASLVGLIATIPCSIAAPSTAQIQEFSSQVNDLVVKRDFDGIRALYYLEGTPPEFISKTMMIWQARVIQDIPDWKFVGVKYFPIDELLNKPGINKTAILSVTKEKQINGVICIPNTKVIGLLSVNFTAGLSGNDFLYPVGISPEGKLCFVEWKKG